MNVLRLSTKQSLERINSVKILMALRQHEGLSKRELCTLCDLSRPTVDKAIEAFMRSGLVQEDGYRTSTGGRRSIVHKFNNRYRYVLGVDFEIPQLNFALCDLSGRMVHRRTYWLPLENTNDPQSLIVFVAQKARHLVEQVGLKLQDVIGLGFGAPAFLKGDTLSFWGETLPPWRDVPVKALLEEGLGVPVLIGNDAAFMALAEWARLPRPAKVLVYLALRQGAYGDIRMGGAVLIDGQVYWGAHGNAVSLREAYAEVPKAKRLEQVLREELTAQPDLKAMRSALEEHLWLPMLNLITIFDPDRLIIQASLLGAEEEPFIRSCARRLKALLRGMFEEVEFSRAQEGEWACAQGAVLYVLHDLFSDPEHLIERLMGRSNLKGKGVRAPSRESALAESSRKTPISIS